MQPHDHLFRFVFSQPEHAAGELQCVLPAELASTVDWSTLTLVPGSFVDPSLQELRTDLLFSAMVGDSRVLFYVLLEHQSTSDHFMALRLLGYMQRIWEHHRREHPDERLLPAIVPVVVSHDDAGWSAPRRFTELLDFRAGAGAAVRPHVVDFEMLIDDISQARDEQLHARVTKTALAQLALFCLQRARVSEDFVGELEQRLDLLRSVLDSPNGVAALSALMRYVSKVTNTKPERLRGLVQRLGPKSEVALMNAAEIWESQGKAIGLAQGKAEGILSVLDARGLTVTPAERERILACGDLAVLDRWLRRAVTVGAAQDVFSD